VEIKIKWIKRKQMTHENTNFVKDLPMIDAQFRFNQCNSFREEYISVFSPYGPVLIPSTRCVFYADRKSKMATTAGHR
jgi:hypothetical protein